MNHLDLLISELAKQQRFLLNQRKTKNRKGSLFTEYPNRYLYKTDNAYAIERHAKNRRLLRILYLTKAILADKDPYKAVRNYSPYYDDKLVSIYVNRYKKIP